VAAPVLYLLKTMHLFMNHEQCDSVNKLRSSVMQRLQVAGTGCVQANPDYS